MGEDKGETSKVGIKIDVNKLKMGMGGAMTVAQIKAQKAAQNKKSEPKKEEKVVKSDPFADESDDGDDILSASSKKQPKKTEDAKPSILDDPSLSAPSLTDKKEDKAENEKTK